MSRSCASKTLIFVIFILQLIATCERQVFDFLGFMWLPILWNFFNIIFIIFGIFGVYQYRSNYVLAYLCWTLVWLGWNLFLVCFYLEVGTLRRDDYDLLTFGTGSFSWWLVNGFGCKPQYFTDNDDVVTDYDAYRPVKPSNVTGCSMEYQYVEVTHAAIQLVLGLGGLIFGILIAHYYVTVINPRRDNDASKAMYSIEYSPQVDDLHHHHHHHHQGQNQQQETDLYSETAENGLRPQMTPRRVKRRSYTRSSSRSVNTKSLARNHRNTRSTRSTGAAASSAGNSRNNNHNTNPIIINPVNRLMMEQEQAGKGDSSTTSNDDARYGMVNPGFQTSRPNSLYGTTITTGNDGNANGGGTVMGQDHTTRPPSALTSYSNFHGQRKPIHQQPHHNVLTQESLIQHVPTNDPVTNVVNQSFDDELPLPPPPLSSSPTVYRHHHHHLLQMEEEEDDSSSVATTAQIPVPQQRNQIRKNEYVNMPVPEIRPSNSIDDGYGDTQTLRADTKLTLPPPKDLNYTKGYDNVDSVKPELPARVPTGNHRKDRASLRAKHRRDLENREQTLIRNNGMTKTTMDEYGFSKVNGHPHSANNGAIPKNRARTPDGIDEKWYLHDSMKPVGASRHGPSCECYRCQRKLTAI